MDGFDSLSSVGGSPDNLGEPALAIGLNRRLQTISGFNALTTVDETLALHDNPALHTISGFNQCAQLHTLSIHDCPKLQTLSGFRQLQRIQRLHLQRGREERVLTNVSRSQLIDLILH